MNRLVTIQDNTIQAMARDPRFTAEFDFVTKVNSVPKTGGCSRCGRRAQNGAVFMDIKRAIAALPDAKKARLKALLNTETCEVFINDGGVPRRITF